MCVCVCSQRERERENETDKKYIAFKIKSNTIKI